MAARGKKTNIVSGTQVKNYVIAAVLSVVLVWLVFLNVSIYRKERVAQAAAKESQAELANLQARQKSLNANVNELSTERGKEGTLRETFGVVKPGEGVIIVVPQPEATTTPPQTFWQKWFGWVPFIN